MLGSIRWKSLETRAGEAVAGEMEQGEGIERSFWNSDDTASSWEAWVRGITDRYRTQGNCGRISTFKDRDRDRIYLGQGKSMNIYRCFCTELTVCESLYV